MLFIKDDKFLGEFNVDKKTVVERSYLDHTPTRRIYFTKVYQKYKPAKAQLVIVHGFAASSNFIEVALFNLDCCQICKAGYQGLPL